MKYKAVMGIEEEDDFESDYECIIENEVEDEDEGLRCNRCSGHGCNYCLMCEY